MGRPHAIPPGKRWIARYVRGTSAARRGSPIEEIGFHRVWPIAGSQLVLKIPSGALSTDRADGGVIRTGVGVGYGIASSAGRGQGQSL